jgi:hypothetical protein
LKKAKPKAESKAPGRTSFTLDAEGIERAAAEMGSRPLDHVEPETPVIPAFVKQSLDSTSRLIKAAEQELEKHRLLWRSIGPLPPFCLMSRTSSTHFTLPKKVSSAGVRLTDRRMGRRSANYA